MPSQGGMWHSRDLDASPTHLLLSTTVVPSRQVLVSDRLPSPQLTEQSVVVQVDQEAGQYLTLQLLLWSASP